jgi:death-on-curing protein
LAASYGFGLAKNHPFVDGNKRTAFLSIGLFMAINGYRLMPDQVDAIQTMVAVASGELDEQGLAAWIAENSISTRRPSKKKITKSRPKKH